MLTQDELLTVISRAQKELHEKFSVQPDGFFRHYSEDIEIPVMIFSEGLSPAETLIKYLKEEKKLAYHQIAKKLKRDQRGIWGGYQRACRKRTLPLIIDPTSPTIPLLRLSDRNFSVFEALSRYLRDEKAMTTKQISALLKKAPSTISTIYHRAKAKEVAR